MLSKQTRATMIGLYGELLKLSSLKDTFNASQAYYRKSEEDAYTFFMAPAFVVFAKHTRPSKGGLARCPLFVCDNNEDAAMMTDDGKGLYQVKDKPVYTYKDLVLNLTPSTYDNILSSQTTSVCIPSLESLSVVIGCDHYLYTLDKDVDHVNTTQEYNASWVKYDADVTGLFGTLDRDRIKAIVKHLQPDARFSVGRFGETAVMTVSDGVISVFMTLSAYTFKEPFDIRISTSVHKYVVSGISGTTYKSITDITAATTNEPNKKVSSKEKGGSMASSVFSTLGNVGEIKPGVKLVSKPDSELVAPEKAAEPVQVVVPTPVEENVAEAVASYEKDAAEASKLNSASSSIKAAQNHAVQTVSNEQHDKMQQVASVIQDAGVSVEVTNAEGGYVASLPNNTSIAETESNPPRVIALENVKRDAGPHESDPAVVPTFEGVLEDFEEIKEALSVIQKGVATNIRTLKGLIKSNQTAMQKALKAAEIAAASTQWKDRALSAESRLRNFEELAKVLEALKK